MSMGFLDRGYDVFGVNRNNPNHLRIIFAGLETSNGTYMRNPGRYSVLVLNDKVTPDTKHYQRILQHVEFYHAVVLSTVAAFKPIEMSVEQIFEEIDNYAVEWRDEAPLTHTSLSVEDETPTAPLNPVIGSMSENTKTIRVRMPQAVPISFGPVTWGTNPLLARHELEDHTSPGIENCRRCANFRPATQIVQRRFD